MHTLQTISQKETVFRTTNIIHSIAIWGITSQIHFTVADKIGPQATIVDLNASMW